MSVVGACSSSVCGGGCCRRAGTIGGYRPDWNIRGIVSLRP